MNGTTLFFDESGFTGTALLDADQPYFCLASSRIPENEAQSLLREAFPKQQGRELKLKSIWKRDQGRRDLIRFAGLMRARSSDVFLWHVDKKFCLLTKMVDYLMEPPLSALGYNFYSNGFPARICNELFYRLRFPENEGLYDATLNPYYRFTQAPSPPNLRDLQITLGIMANSVHESVRFHYNLLARGAMSFEEHSRLDTFKDSNEIQLTSMLASVTYWRQRSSARFRIIHDQSRAFFKDRALWAAITSDRVPDQLHPLGDGSEVPFPLRVSETVAGDSRDYNGIQLCDMLAGLMTRMEIERQRDGEGAVFTAQLIEAGLGELTFNGIRPAFLFPDGPPAKATGPDAVDRMAEIIFGDSQGRDLE